MAYLKNWTISKKTSGPDLYDPEATMDIIRKRG
jgi:hypothetical protein